MIVVSDSSPLNYLVLIQAVDVLPKLYNEVIIPSAVQRELQHDKTPQLVRAWLETRPVWLSVRDSGKLDPGLEKLDAGEAEAITLANSLRADHLLIDERLGTRLAKKAGLRPLSLLAVLDQAAGAGLIDIREKLDRLQTKTTYRMTQTLAKKLLTRDAERRQKLE